MTIKLWERIVAGIILAALGLVEFMAAGPCGEDGFCGWDDGIGWLLFVLAIVLVVVFIRYLWLRAHPGQGNTLQDLIHQVESLDKVIKDLSGTIKRLTKQLAETNSALADAIIQRDELRQKIKEHDKLGEDEEKVSNKSKVQVYHNISVLMATPRSDLPLVNSETQDVQRSGLVVTPTYNPISQVSLTREMSAKDYDGFWFAGHMAANGDLQLDSGELMPANALTALVRGRYKWVFLNSCQSVQAALGLQNETDVDVICTVVDVPDIEAYRTGSLFGNALAKLGDTREAYEQSRPGNNRVYLFLAGNRKK